MKRIKVMHISFSLDIGGAEMVILDLCRHMRGTEFEPMVCSMNRGGSLKEEFIKQGIPVFEVEKKEGKDWKLLFKLYDVFRTVKPDVVHAHLSYMWLYSILPARAAGVKGFILTEHSSKIHPTWLFRFLSRIFQSLTDFITVNSDQIRQALVDDEGLRSRGIVVLPNGMDMSSIRRAPDPSLVRAGLGVSKQVFLACMVSRLYPPKDPFTLIEAVSRLSSDIPFMLFFIGGGIQEEEMIRMVHERNLEERIKFLGYRRDIHELLSAMDLFILSSIKEGQSISIMEAMAVGLPVIATGTGGTPELVIHEQTGLLVPERDPVALSEAMLRCIGDRGYSLQLGSAGRKRIEQVYAMNAIIQKYADLYRTVCGIR